MPREHVHVETDKGDMITKGGVGCAVSGILMLAAMVFSALLLTSCQKDYSYEAPCVETTTTTWLDGVVIESSRRVDRPLRNDTSYSIGSARPAVVVVKTECK